MIYPGRPSNTDLSYFLLQINIASLELTRDSQICREKMPKTEHIVELEGREQERKLHPSGSRHRKLLPTPCSQATPENSQYPHMARLFGQSQGILHLNLCITLQALLLTNKASSNVLSIRYKTSYEEATLS